MTSTRDSSSRPRVFAMHACLWVGSPLTLVSCGDPVRDEAIAALGPEAPGVSPGPLHRPGQPCLLCHQDGGRASAFSLAGTVYVNTTSTKTLANADVIALDSAGVVFTSSTNCAGNFYVLPSKFVPSYPVWFTLRAAGKQRDMSTPSYREGSCAFCHTNMIGPASPGPVYLFDDPIAQPPPANQCP